jgi:hypothetical protein
MDKEQMIHFDHLERLIASTFAHIVAFARQATEYYGSWTHRLKDTFRSEPSKNKIVELIRKNLEEIRNGCDMLMLLKISSLERKVSDMSVHVGEIRKDGLTTSFNVSEARREVSKVQLSWNISHLTELRRLLNVPERSDHTNLDHYKKILMQTLFGRAASGTRHIRPRQITMDLLTHDADFASWWQSKKSCMFLAGGSNFDQPSGSVDLNWISLAAVLVAEEARRRNYNTAVYLAQTDFTVNRRRRSTNWAIIASLIYQIAQMHENLLTNKFDTIQEIVSAAAWKSSSAKDFMEHVDTLFLEILGEFPADQEIYLIIDRLDKCQCAEEEDESCDAHSNMLYYMEGLLRIAADAPCCLKIFLSVNASQLHRGDRKEIVLNSKQREALLWKNDWSQATEDVY